jgi:hypothetical protein
MFKVFPASLQTFVDTRLTLTPSLMPNSNYVIMVSDLNYLKYFCLFFSYCNYQVHRHFFITLYTVCVRRLSRDLCVNYIIKNIYMFSCNSCHVLIKLEIFETPNFMKSRPLLAQLFYASRYTEGQTNVQKRIVAFRDFWNAPRSDQIFGQYHILVHRVV